MSTDTRHLDTAIAILGGAGGAKRAKRKAQVELHLHIDEKTDLYTLTANGKLLEEGTVGSCLPSTPYQRMEARAAGIRKLGKTVSTNVSRAGQDRS